MYRWVILVLILVGGVDSLYLTREHYSEVIPPCTVSRWADCGKVLESEYAVVAGVPLALFGVVHYGLMLVWWMGGERKWSERMLVGQSVAGVVVSGYLVYVQLAIIGAICQYCMVSAGASMVLCGLVLAKSGGARRWWICQIMRVTYKGVVKRLLFLSPAEVAHTSCVRTGEILTSFGWGKKFLEWCLRLEDVSLERELNGIKMRGPVGLAAGFDYEARLTGAMGAIGMGFMTIGTITNLACEGNSGVRLGRLPRSKSLLVNKGFRNPGADVIIKKLEGREFDIPVGVSIGRTNSLQVTTLKQSVEDIVGAFVKFEKSRVRHSYYELNISCPNLGKGVEFYEVKNLRVLLDAIAKLKIKRPIWVKMPIGKSNDEFLDIVKEVKRYKLAGIVVGNLQTRRDVAGLDRDEILAAGVGNLSGKPTFERSNDLIKLARREVGDKMTIVGCGGVFGIDDYRRKIASGADLVQMITGMIYEGPQVVCEINMELALGH